MLHVFHRQACRIVIKWLNRRSQRKRCNWQGFREMLEYFNVPRPRIIGYWNLTMRLYEANNTEEPCAGKPHAGICEGCALQAHEIQLPEMAAAVKLSQQLRTESCVVFGNGHCEA
jgi:hypothetical protein